MDSRRSLLVIALLFISFLIYQQWEIDNNPQPAQTATQTQVDKSEVPTTVSTAANTTIDNNQQQGKIITLQSDVLRLKIDTLGGDIVEAQLLKYGAELHSETPFALLKIHLNKFILLKAD